MNIWDDGLNWSDWVCFVMLRAGLLAGGGASESGCVSISKVVMSHAVTPGLRIRMVRSAHRLYLSA